MKNITIIKIIYIIAAVSMGILYINTCEHSARMEFGFTAKVFVFILATVLGFVGCLLGEKIRDIFKPVIEAYSDTFIKTILGLIGLQTIGLIIGGALGTTIVWMIIK